MKKILSIVLALCLFLSLALPAAAAETLEKTLFYREIAVYLNGVKLSPADEKGQPTEPFIMDGSTYLPLRAVTAALGLSAEWIAATNTVSLKSGGESNPGSGDAPASLRSEDARITYRDIGVCLDGEPLSLAAEPFIMGGSTYLPLRAMGEALGLSVDWDGDTNTVTLLSEGVGMERVVETRARYAEGQYSFSRSEIFTIRYSDRVHTLTYSDGGRDEVIEYLDEAGLSLRSEYLSGGVLTATDTWQREGDYVHYTHDSLTDDGEDTYIRYLYRDGVLLSAREYGGSSISVVHSTDHSYSYDGAGNLIRHYIHSPDASWEEILYTYDEENRLLSMAGEAYSIHTNNFARYRCDYYYEDGVLVRTEATGAETDYFYAADGSLSKTVTTRYDDTVIIKEYK